MGTEQWTIYNKCADFDGICRRFGISPVTARLLVNRDITDPDEIGRFLHPGLNDLYSPHLMKGMDDAVSLVLDKISAGRRIRVIGDYDVDGIMSTYILTDALRRAGAVVDSYIPHRIRDGYGLNSAMIVRAHEDGIDTVITCDNGISAVDAAEEAGRLGVTLVVTDHHEIPDVLPAAQVIVDPKQEGDNYPCRDICGAVVASKLAEALFESLGHACEPGLYLEYMAMATICDVVPLQGENRTIACLGLNKLRTTDNAGLLSLMRYCQIEPQDLSEYHIGFILGPCFNATGRIDDAEIALEMLSCDDPARADVLAKQCHDLNEERKVMTSEQEQVAFGLLDPDGGTDRVIVLELPDCHESILGIIAGRIKERYNKPAIVVTRSGNGYKGSARSIPAYNMFGELNRVSSLLTKFGGHPMAAGLSLAEDKLDEFRRALNDNCTLTDNDMKRKLMLDAEVSFSVFTEEVLDELALMAPFGQNNPAPLFAERGLKVRSIRYMGRDNSFLKLRLINGYGGEINATYFLDARELVDRLTAEYGSAEVDRAFSGRDNALTLTVAYQARVNDFRDIREIQMNIKSVR